MKDYMLPKEQRHQVYKEALVEYQYAIKRKLFTGLCYSIHSALKTLEIPGLDDNIDPYYNMKTAWPEIFIAKPAITSDFWWSKCEVNIRIEVLKEAIESTKP